MCLAVPGKVLCIQEDAVGRSARVDFGGMTREVRLDLVPEAKLGDYVIVHVGFAISRMNTDEAERTLRLIDEISSKRLIDELQSNEEGE